MKKLVLLSTVVLLGLSACLAESQNNWFDQSQDHVNHETSETTHSSHSKVNLESLVSLVQKKQLTQLMPY